MNSLPTLSFTTQYAPELPIRPAAQRYTDSALRGVIEISDGIRPDSFRPHRNLPVKFIDTTTGDGVVIVKGTIVAIVDAKNATSGSPEASGLTPASSGQFPIGVSAVDSNPIWVGVEASPFGLDNLVAGYLVPANGGTQSTEPYSADDVTVGTLKADGTYATASDNFTIPANAPVGIVTKDVYQDIRGKYLNYSRWDTTGILCDYYVMVPFIDSAVSGAPTCVTENTSTASVYFSTWKTHAFMYRPAGRSLGSGILVQSDLHGKFVPQAATTVTSQTVGKIVVCDSRYPKADLDRVTTYPGSETQGTDTGGLPSVLYGFVNACLTVQLGVAPTKLQVLDSVREGKFGMAKIQLIVS